MLRNKKYLQLTIFALMITSGPNTNVGAFQSIPDVEVFGSNDDFLSSSGEYRVINDDFMDDANDGKVHDHTSQQDKYENCFTSKCRTTAY